MDWGLLNLESVSEITWLCAVLYWLLNTGPLITLEIWTEPKSDPRHTVGRLCTACKRYSLE